MDSSGEDRQLVESIHDTRSLRQPPSSRASPEEVANKQPRGSKMAGKSETADVFRYVLWAYVAGIVTGLALFGAGSFYFNAAFH